LTSIGSPRKRRGTGQPPSITFGAVVGVILSGGAQAAPAAASAHPHARDDCEPDDHLFAW
jgi:hypothetical protein